MRFSLFGSTDKLTIKRCPFQAPHRFFIYHLFRCDLYDLRIRHRKKPLHVLYSFQAGSDIKAIKPLKNLVSAFCLLGPRQPQMFDKRAKHDLPVCRILNECDRLDDAPENRIDNFGILLEIRAAGNKCQALIRNRSLAISNVIRNPF